MRYLVFLALAAFLLTGCQTPVAIVLGPEVEALRALLEPQRGEVERATGRQYVFMTRDEAKVAKPERLLVISANEDFQEPALTSASAFPLLPGTPYSTAGVWTRELRNSDGTWRSLPLFFDLPGVTHFTTKAEPAKVFHPWSKLSDKTMLVAGAALRMRGLVWFGVTGTDALPGSSDFERFSKWLSETAFVRDTWQFSRADFDLNYHAGDVDFLETFRDFYRANPVGFRTFTPLASAEGSLVRVAGRLVTLRVFSKDASDVGAGAWAKILVGRKVQQAYSQSSGWMAAEFSTPVLDTASASARSLVIQSTDFRATSSLTPEVLRRLDVVFGSDHSPAKE